MTAEADAPRIWLDLTQEALDRAYDQTVYAPNFAQLIKRFGVNSAAAATRLGAPQGFKYGDTAIETLSYYAPPRLSAPLDGPTSSPILVPIHVHVHGGAWRQRLAKDMLFLAEPFLDAGVGFTIFDFTSVEETDGALEPMVAQVRKALAWVARNADDLGGDPAQLTLSGFSSGAHLASAALIGGWEEFGFAEAPFRSAFLASGMYELLPVSLSKRSEYVRFLPETLEGLSAQRHAGRLGLETTIACGSFESPEFRRQAREFAAALRDAGQPAQLLEAEGYNHYEVLESFSAPFSPIGRALLAQARATLS